MSNWFTDTWDEITSGGEAETETYNGSSSSSNKSNNSSSSGGGSSSNKSNNSSSSGGGSKNTVPTNQDRINEIYASTDNPWDTYGAELNDLLSAGRSSAYTGATSSGGGNSTVSNRGTTSGGSTSSGGGGSTSSGGRTSSGGSSSKTTKKAQVNRNGKKVEVDVLGQVSANGQYAGDGFEWTQNDNTNALSRVYTGAGKGNGLGSAVIQAGSADSTLKETIAGISLNEGSSFAGAKSSATDGSFFDMFKPEDERKRSGSYAEQVGNTNYKPSLGVLESSSSPGSFGDAFADARKSGKDVFDYNGSSFNTQLAPEPRPLDSVRPQIRPDEVFALGDAEAAKIDYTPDYGSMGFGERGRGGPNALPSAGNPLQALVDLRDTVPSALSAGERLQANQFENSNSPQFNYDPSGSYDVAQAGPGFPGGGGSTLTPASSLVDMFTNPRLGYEAGRDFVTSLQDLAPSLRPLREGISDEFYGRTSEPRVNVQETMAAADAKVPTTLESLAGVGSDMVNALRNVPKGVLNEVADAIEGVSTYNQATRPMGVLQDGSTNPFISTELVIADEIQKLFRDPNSDYNKANILSQDQSYMSPLDTAIDKASGVLRDGASALGEFFNAGDTAVIDSGKGPLADQVSNINATGTYDKVLNMMAEEGIAGAGIDLLMSLNAPGRLVGAGFNAAEATQGLNTQIATTLAEQYKKGALDGNATFREALKAQNGDVPAALNAVADLAYNQNYGKVGTFGAVDMFGPKGVVSTAAREGAQGGAENYAAYDAINRALNTNFDPMTNIVGAAATEALAGAAGGSAVTGVDIFSNAVSSRQNKEMTDAVDASDAAMGNLPGPAASLVSAGELSLAPTPAPAPAPAPAPSTSPATGTAPSTLAPAVPTSGLAPVQVAKPSGIATVVPDQIAYDPTVFPTSGQLAKSTVESSFNPPIPAPATSIDAMAAQEILNDLAREASFTGEQVSSEILDNIMGATGLGMDDIGSMMEQAYNDASADPDPQSSVASSAGALDNRVKSALTKELQKESRLGPDYNNYNELNNRQMLQALLDEDQNIAALGDDSGIPIPEDRSRLLIDEGIGRDFGSTVPSQTRDTPEAQLARQQENRERAANNRAKTQAEAEAVAGMEAADLSLPVDPGGVASLQNFDTQGVPLVDSPAAQADRRRAIANRLKGEAEAAAMAPLNTAQDALDAVDNDNTVAKAEAEILAQRAEMLEANKTYQDYIQTKAKLEAVNAAIKDGEGQFGPNGTGDPNFEQVDFEQAVADNQFGDADSLVVDSPPTIIRGGEALPASDVETPVENPEMSFEEAVSIINAEGTPNIIRGGAALPASDVENPVVDPEISFDEAVSMVPEVDADGNTVIEVAQVPAIVPTAVPPSGSRANPSPETLEGDILYELTEPSDKVDAEDDEGVTIDVDGTFDGEILNPEISTEVNGTNPDGSVTIDLDAETDPSTPAISPPPKNTDPSTVPTTNTTARPLIEVDVDRDEEEEEGVDVEVPNSPFVFELGGDDDPRRKVPKAGVAPAMEECPDGYVQVRGPDGRLMCQKTFTQNRQRAGASTQAYTGINSGKQRGSGQTRKEYEVVQEFLSPNEKETAVEVDAKSLLGML
jgi:hypothetical protein